MVGFNSVYIFNLSCEVSLFARAYVHANNFTGPLRKECNLPKFETRGQWLSQHSTRVVI